MVDQQTVDRMKICQRWPIPEMLLSRPDGYKLKVDSLMAEVYTVEYAREWAKYRQEIDAPLNSMSSGEEPDMYATDTEDEKQRALTTRRRQQERGRTQRSRAADSCPA